MLKQPIPFKKPQERMIVEVYRNLHKDCWSVRNPINGLVLFHTDAIHLSDAKFVVHQSGRSRVIQEKRKNVHAFIKGTIEPEPNINGVTIYKQYKPVTYNPYLDNSFMCGVTLVANIGFGFKAIWEPIYNADKVYLDSDLKAWAFTYEKSN